MTTQPGVGRPDGASPIRLTVAVLTFRRPEQLGQLLPLLVAQLRDLEHHRSDYATRVVVVDNDAAGSARDVVRAAAAERVRYVVEPTPGISAARNRALDEAGDDDVLVFIDDDETPHPGWLVGLVETHERTGAGAVAGAVVSQFATEPDPFVSAGGFFERAHRQNLTTGSPITRAATNNLLLDLHPVRAHGLRFDQRFGVSGGEDSLFTGQLHRAGVAMVWSSDAVVTDHVPAERLTRGYALHRTAALASTGVHAELALLGSVRDRARHRAVTAAREGVRLLLALPATVVGALTHDLEKHARGRRSLARAQGSFRALAGRWPAPYARPGTDD